MVGHALITENMWPEYGSNSSLQKSSKLGHVAHSECNHLKAQANGRVAGQ